MIPPCSLCCSPRAFEFQILPQLFDVLKELILVDWNTLAFYTCTNSKCVPKKGAGYIREYAYVQFGEDFSKVQYGDEQEIKR